MRKENSDSEAISEKMFEGNNVNGSSISISMEKDLKDEDLDEEYIAGKRKRIISYYNLFHIDKTDHHQH